MLAIDRGTNNTPPVLIEVAERLEVHFDFEAESIEHEHSSFATPRPSESFECSDSAQEASYHSTSVAPPGSTSMIATTRMSCFARSMARTETEVLALQVVVPKDKRGDPGSKQQVIHYSGATSALESKFGAAQHFVPTSWEGECDSDLCHNIRNTAKLTT